MFGVSVVWVNIVQISPQMYKDSYKQIKCQVFGVEMLRQVLNATQANVLGVSCTVHSEYVISLLLFQCKVQLVGREVDE